MASLEAENRISSSRLGKGQGSRLESESDYSILQVEDRKGYGKGMEMPNRQD